MNQPEAKAHKPGKFGRVSRVLLGILIILVFALVILTVIPRFRGKAYETVELGSHLFWATFGTTDSPNSEPLETGRLSLVTGPLRVDAANPRYFTDGNGKAILLAGSHTWDNRQDQGTGDFDWSGYLDDLEAWGHNFFRLWVWEQPKGITTSPDPVNPNATLTPEIWLRTGPGNANDGGLKFDLTQYNSDHFDRLRQRVIEAGNRGFYVSIMLFDGWSVEQRGGGTNPWLYHPFNEDNNINGIDGDPNNDKSGRELDTLDIPAVTALQEAYVQKVIDTVNDLDNVLYEICNEPAGDTLATDWLNHFIDYIHTYEAGKPKQHPVGMTGFGDNDALFASNAEWVSPGVPGDYFDNPPANDGSKVIVLDNDHIFGIGGDRSWYWKGFTRGLNLLYMDAWDGHFLYGTGDQNVRDNLGWIREYANRMNLEAMTPHGELSSSGYALANPAPSRAEYLVYLPDGGSVTVDLSGVSGTLNVEWFNPGYGTITSGGITTGGSNRSFSAPFSGDAVLYIFQSGSISTPTPTSTSTATSTPTLTPTFASTLTPTTTPINEGLIITGVQLYPLDTLALVAWKTNRPATGRVDYGISPILDMSTQETMDHVITHSIWLTGLIPDTTYVYQLYSQDLAGISATSLILNFSTLSAEEVKRMYLPIITFR